MQESSTTGTNQMNASISQVALRQWARGLLAAAAIGLAVTAGATPASAKVSPPEEPVGVHEHKVWPDPGPLHPNDDACDVGFEEFCDEGSVNDPGEPDPQWGGPGERIAVGRDMDMDAAKDEAEDEANDVCHGDWDMRDFHWDIAVGSPTVYTLTYECS